MWLNNEAEIVEASIPYGVDMNEFLLHLDLDTLTRTRMGTISAQVWTSLSGCGFPEEGWSDMPLAVLDSIKSAIDFLRAGAASSTSSFFDGPFELLFTLSGSTDVLVTGVDRRGVLPALATQTTLDAIEEELSRVQADLLAAVRARGWPET